MLDLNSLKNAFSKIAEIGKGEETFDLNGTKITVRLLLPSEEIEVQKQSSFAYTEEGKESGENSTLATTKYLETFKLGVLSYAIVQVNDLDLRNTEFIPTGENLPNGKPVKITKTKAVKDLLLSFSRRALDTIFQKYTDLSTKTDIESDKSLEYTPIDISEEITRLEERLEELKRKQEISKNFAKKEEEPIVEEKIETVVEEKAVVEEPTIVENVEPSAPRQRVMPQQVAPPTENKKQIPPMSKEQVLETMQSSFVDKKKDEPFPESALLQEHERLNRLRQTQHRKPPHMQAKKTMENIGQNMSENVGEIDGVPVFRTQPPSDITRTPSAKEQGNISIDSQPSASNNPRFRR